MMSRNNRYVVCRENNVLRVDFSREPEPPAPHFPGAGGLREITSDDCQLGFGPVATKDAA